MNEDGAPVVITLKRVAHEQWFLDPRWMTPRTELVRFMRVVEAFEDPKEITLRDDDWEVLCKIVKDCSHVSPLPAVQLQIEQRFTRKLLEARETK